MNNWDEIKTAYHVARMGTVSGAAEVLGVHHATVIRHIDTREGELGVKLFQRHARGYTPTEVGDDLFRVAQATDDQFNQLMSRIKGQGADVSGELVVTSLEALVPRLTPLLTLFQQEHPDVVIHYLTGKRLFRLEYGEAHVAIRAGMTSPNQPDNVVQPFVIQRLGLYASKAYVARHGLPDAHADWSAHRFVGYTDGTPGPFNAWLKKKIPEAKITFHSMDVRALEQAVQAGAGIGFVSEIDARATANLVEITPRENDWVAPLWLVTHVDLHRTAKVQALLTFLKRHAHTWER